MLATTCCEVAQLMWKLICWIVFWYLGQFTVKDVKPSPDGESVKVKVKVRVNLHGILTVSSASLVLKQDATEQDTNEQDNVAPDAMDTEPQKNEPNEPANQQQEQTESTQENHICNEVRICVCAHIHGQVLMCGSWSANPCPLFLKGLGNSSCGKANVCWKHMKTI